MNITIKTAEDAAAYLAATAAGSHCLTVHDRMVLDFAAAKLRELEAENARLREDRDRGLRIAYGVTLECQTVEEAISDLVRMVRAGRCPQ